MHSIPTERTNRQVSTGDNYHRFIPYTAERKLIGVLGVPQKIKDGARLILASFHMKAYKKKGRINTYVEMPTIAWKQLFSNEYVQMFDLLIQIGAITVKSNYWKDQSAERGYCRKYIVHDTDVQLHCVTLKRLKKYIDRSYERWQELHPSPLRRCITKSLDHYQIPGRVITDTSGRCYAPYTHMSKDHRLALIPHAVSRDLSADQPFILFRALSLITEERLQRMNDTTLPTLPTFLTCLLSENEKKALFVYAEKHVVEIAQESEKFVKYYDADIYTTLYDRDRDKGKKLVMYYLFGHVHPAEQIFQTEFPVLHGAISLIKQGCPKRWHHILTRLEVEFMTQVMQAAQAVGIYPLTVHDEFLLPEADNERFLAIYEDVAHAFFGDIIPRIK